MAHLRHPSRDVIVGPAEPLSPLDALASQTRKLSTKRAHQHRTHHHQYQHEQPRPHPHPHHHYHEQHLPPSSLNQTPQQAQHSSSFDRLRAHLQPPQLSTVVRNNVGSVATERSYRWDDADDDDEELDDEEFARRTRLLSLDINGSALSQLTASLQSGNRSEGFAMNSFRRPSTGQVNSQQPQSQVPREQITSVYGDQHEFLPDPNLPPSPHRPTPAQQPTTSSPEEGGDGRAPGGGDHSVRPTSSRYSSGSSHHSETDDRDGDRHKTWLTTTSSNSFFESESGRDLSPRYGSGHSMAGSEDPFEYMHYESSRDQESDPSRQDSSTRPSTSAPLNHLVPPLQSIQTHNRHSPSSTSAHAYHHPHHRPPISPSPSHPGPSVPGSPVQDHDPSSRPDSTSGLHLARNFSRPLRPPTANGLAANSVAQLPTLPPSREISPRDNKPRFGPPSGARELISHNERLASSLRAAVGTAGVDEHDLPTVTSRGVKSTSGRHQSSKRLSKSSVDTMSSNGTKRSWKDLFTRRRAGSNHSRDSSYHEAQQSRGNNTGTSENGGELPSITFSRPDPSQRALNPMWEDINSRSEASRNRREQEEEKARQAAYAAPLNTQQHSHHSPEIKLQTQNSYYDRVPAVDPKDLDPMADRRPSNQSHRLSIYSLGTYEGPGAMNEHNHTTKQPYISRSPVSLSGFSMNSRNEAGSNREEQQIPTNHVPNPPFTNVPLVQRRMEGTGASYQSRTSNLPSAMAKTKASLMVNQNSNGSGKKTAQDYLQMGIEAHEKGDLERAAGLFERSARENGGCGGGMLMWGLSLRHGWGCGVNEERAFKWLQKAAESVIEDLDLKIPQAGPPSGALSQLGGVKTETAAAKCELVLAIYELGQCFMRGWGCKKDKALVRLILFAVDDTHLIWVKLPQAISYFELAAKLGDPDAQQELGFCYTNGQGTKKDLKMAAKYYRMAAQQGVEMMGCQWIWKDKGDGEQAQKKP